MIFFQNLLWAPGKCRIVKMSHLRGMSSQIIYCKSLLTIMELSLHRILSRVCRSNFCCREYSLPCAIKFYPVTKVKVIFTQPAMFLWHFFDVNVLRMTIPCVYDIPTSLYNVWEWFMNTTMCVLHFSKHPNGFKLTHSKFACQEHFAC